MILDEIVEDKKKQLEHEKGLLSIEGWKQRIKRSGLHKTVDFYRALKNIDDISIIAEVKRASPSKGIIRKDFKPAEIAGEYTRAGVQAISVLTEKNHFMGDDNYLVKIRQNTPLPLLRKDFVIDIWQVYQSRYLGADAILLIASILEADQLKRFRVVAEILGMKCLVEVHNMKELDKALESGASIIGINNRDLKDFKVDLTTTAKIINHIPHDCAVVSESGIKSPDDLKYLKQLGADAVLVGERFMRSESIFNSVKELITKGDGSL